MKFGEVWISALFLGLLCNIKTDGQRTNDPIWYGPMAVRPSVWELKQTEQPNDHFQITFDRTDNQIKLPAINHVAINKNYDEIGRKQTNFNFPNKLYSKDIQQSKIDVWGPGDSQQKENINLDIKSSEPKHGVSNTEKSFRDIHSIKNGENGQLMPEIILAEFNPHQDGITVSTHGIDVTNFRLYNPGSTLVSPNMYDNERNNQEDYKNKLDGQYKNIGIDYSSKDKQENPNIDDKTGENVQIGDKRFLPDTYNHAVNSAWTQDGYRDQIPNIRKTDRNSQFSTSKTMENPGVSDSWQGGLNHPMNEDNLELKKNFPNSERAWPAEKNSQNSLNNRQEDSNHENSDREWRNEGTVHISDGIWKPSDSQHKLNDNWRSADGHIKQSEWQEAGQQENKDSNYHSDINQPPSFGNWQPEKNQHTSDKDWSPKSPHQNDGNSKQSVNVQVPNENWNQDGHRDESNGERLRENRPIVNSPNNLENKWTQQEKVDSQNWKPESNFQNREKGRNAQDWQLQVHSRDVNNVEDNMQAWFPNQSPDSTQEISDDWNENDRQLTSPFDHDQRYNPGTLNKENSFDGHKTKNDRPQYDFQSDIGSLSDPPIENNWKPNDHDVKNSNSQSNKDIFFSGEFAKNGDGKNMHGVNNEFNEETYNQSPIKGDNDNFDTSLRQPENNRFNLNAVGKNGDPASSVSPFNRGNPQGNYKGGDGDRYLDEGPREVSFESTIPGTAGVDYPNHTSIPQTEFNCANHNYPGYFADTEARCQVYHVCQSDGRHNSFLCPIGTIFNQKLLTCDWWFQYDCENSMNYYSLNQMLYREHDPQGNYKGSHFEGTRMPQVFPQLQPPPPEAAFLLPENNNLGDSRKVLTDSPDFPGKYQPARGDDLPLGEIPDVQGIISRDGNGERINKIHHPVPGNAENSGSNNPYNGNTFDDKFAHPERYPSINLDNEIILPEHNSGANSDDGWIQQGNYPEVNLNNENIKSEHEFRPENNIGNERIMPESHSKDNGWIQQEYKPENDLSNDWVKPEYHPNTDLLNGRTQPGQYPQTDLDNERLKPQHHSNTDLHGRTQSGQYPQTDLDNERLRSEYHPNTDLQNERIQPGQYPQTYLDDERLRPEYHPNTDIPNGRIQPDQYTQTNLDNRRTEHSPEDSGGEEIQRENVKPQLNDGWVNTENHQNPHLGNTWVKQDESNTEFENKWNEPFEPESTSGNMWKNNEQDTGQKHGHNQIIKPNVNDEDQRNTPDQAKKNMGNEWTNPDEVKLNTGNGWRTQEQVKIDAGNEWYTPQQAKINVESQWKKDDPQFRSENNGQWSDLEQSKLNPDDWNRNYEYDQRPKNSNDWNGDQNNENAWIEDRKTEMPHYSDLKENNNHFHNENRNYNTRRQDVNLFEENTEDQWKYPEQFRENTEQTEQIASEKDRISLVDRSSESALESIRLPIQNVENKNTETAINRENDSSDRARLLISRKIGNLDELRQNARLKVEEGKKISSNEDDGYSQDILLSKESTDINAAQENHTFSLNEMDPFSEEPIYENVLKQENDFDFKIADKEKLPTTENPFPNSENMNKNGDFHSVTERQNPASNIASDKYDANLVPKNDLEEMNRMKNISENQTSTSSMSDDRNSKLNYNENQFDPKQEKLGIVEQLTSQKNDEFIPLGSDNFFIKNNRKGNLEKNNRVQNLESASSGIRKGRRLMYRVRKRAKFGSIQDASMLVKGLNQGSMAEESSQSEIVALPSNIFFTSEVISTANVGNIRKLRDKDGVDKFPKTFEKMHFSQKSSIFPLKMPHAGTSVHEIDDAERTNGQDQSKSLTTIGKELSGYGTRISKIANSDRIQKLV